MSSFCEQTTDVRKSSKPLKGDIAMALANHRPATNVVVGGSRRGRNRRVVHLRETLLPIILSAGNTKKSQIYFLNHLLSRWRASVPLYLK